MFSAIVSFHVISVGETNSNSLCCLGDVWDLLDQLLVRWYPISGTSLTYGFFDLCLLGENTVYPYPRFFFNYTFKLAYKVMCFHWLYTHPHFWSAHHHSLPVPPSPSLLKPLTLNIPSFKSCILKFLPSLTTDLHIKDQASST